mmetsp:Transcript_17519/g.51125  ORF Transcript_17519/g.51125 Transcript_17519/m.51125 type:complete len:112 (-) Transcript_17519:1537-1872(-)
MRNVRSPQFVHPAIPFVHVSCNRTPNLSDGCHTYGTPLSAEGSVEGCVHEQVSDPCEWCRLLDPLTGSPAAMHTQEMTIRPSPTCSWYSTKGGTMAPSCGMSPRPRSDNLE